MSHTENVNQIFFHLFEQQTFAERELDYSILEKHKPHLQKLADIGNCVVTVLDTYRKQHVFNSSNLGAVFGYSPQEVEKYGEHFLNAIIHPEDFPLLMQNGLTALKLYLNFSEEEKLNYKIINEFRVLNASAQYIRVIEQHQALELDGRGNLWLALSILDISPNQEINEGLKSQLLNFRTGEFLSLAQEPPEIKIALTKREAQILKLVKEGFLSKEISNRLSISVHTVNTHRQRVLEKLGANNSMEAVVFSSKLGLV
jgi:DNA-binding CsgD family transcriptional regulator